MPEDHFSGEVAARYDESSGSMFNGAVLGPTVEVLAELAGGGAALEFAIGTGRVALPLAGRGVRVSGIELSTDMAAQLRAKDGDERIEVTIGDMAVTRVDGSFRLVYLVFNTIGNLTTQDQQVVCFDNAAAHLDVGGFFVIEVGVPDLRRVPPGEDARVCGHARATWVMTVTRTSLRSRPRHTISWPTVQEHASSGRRFAMCGPPSST